MYRLKKGYDRRIAIASTPTDWEIVANRKPTKKDRGIQAKA